MFMEVTWTVFANGHVSLAGPLPTPQISLFEGFYSTQVCCSLSVVEVAFCDFMRV